MPALTLTRRAALGSGLAASSLVCFGNGARGQAVPAVDALFVDASIRLPATLAPFIEARRHLMPVIDLRFDAAAYAGLHQILATDSAIAGISSGAALFCLERIAWDHGFRLVGRIERRADDIAHAGSPRDLAQFLGGLDATSQRGSVTSSGYRPSRTDGLLHAWAMQRRGERFRLPRRDAA